MFRTCLQFNFILFVFILTIVLTLFTGLCCLRHGDQYCQACSEASPCQGTTGLVSIQEGIQRSLTALSSTCAANAFLTSFSRPCIVGSPSLGSHGKGREGIMALRLVLETLQAEPQPLSGLWHLLGKSRHHLRPSGTGSQSAATAAAMGQWRYEYMESMVESWPHQRQQRPKSPRRSQSRGRKGNGKGKGKANTSYNTTEPQFGPAALGIQLPAPPWQPTPSTASTVAGAAPPAPASTSDAQLRGFLIEMKKIPDMPADAHAIMQKYAKKQRSATTKTMHQSVTGPQRSSGGLGSSPSCSTSLAWILENVSWRSLGNVASIYRGVQTAGGCPFGTNRRSSAKPPLRQGGLRGMPQRSHRSVQERPAADRKCRSGDVYRACGRSHSCPASTRLGLDAWPSDQFEKQCRSHGRRLQQFCQETPPERTHRSHRRGGRWGSLIAWAIGAFWHGPQVTSALPSSCAGLVAPEVSHAAILAWTHSIWEEPTFTTVWQASFRALCLSFDLGTLQPSNRHAVERHTSRPAL